MESVLSGFASDQNPYSALRAALHSQMCKLLSCPLICDTEMLMFTEDSEPNKVFGIQIWILTGLLGVCVRKSGIKWLP